MNRQIEIEKLVAETTSDPRWLLLVARDRARMGSSSIRSRGQGYTAVRRVPLALNVQKTCAFMGQLRRQRKQASEPANDVSRLDFR
jgi:hypothetical protein